MKNTKKKKDTEAEKYIQELEQESIFAVNSVKYHTVMAELIACDKDLSEFSKEEYKMAMLSWSEHLFMALYGTHKIPDLARSRSSYDFEELRMQQEKKWNTMFHLFTIFQNMINSKDEKLENRTSLNVASYILEEKRKAGEIEDIAGNPQNQKKIWKHHKKMLHVILAIQFMKNDFQEQLKEYDYDFDKYVITNWTKFDEYMNYAITLVTSLKLPKTRKSLITKRELMIFEKGTDKKLAGKLENISKENLKDIAKSYRAPKPYA